MSKEIYSNPLFDEEFIFIMIDPHHFNVESGLIEYLLNQDSPIISSSSKVDSLLDEFASELILLKSIPPGIDEADCDPEEEIRLIEILLIAYSLSLLKNESSHFDISSYSRPHAKPPNDDEIESNSEILTVKVVGDIFVHYVSMPRLLPTQPTLVSNQEKSPHLLSHRGLKALQLSFETPMMIYGGNIPILGVPFLHFYPINQLKYGGNRVKLSDPKQALRGRHPMLILVVVVVMNKCVLCRSSLFLFLCFVVLYVQEFLDFANSYRILSSSLHFLTFIWESYIQI
nr:hypothetical protein [Tanacetum cinerariifolium]